MDMDHECIGPSAKTPRYTYNTWYMIQPTSNLFVHFNWISQTAQGYWGQIGVILKVISTLGVLVNDNCIPVYLCYVECSYITYYGYLYTTL